MDFWALFIYNVLILYYFFFQIRYGWLSLRLEVIVLAAELCFGPGYFYPSESFMFSKISVAAAFKFWEGN
jgi:hypothetical protein